MKHSLIVFIILLALSSYGRAEVVKCVDDQGKIEYREAPCPADKKNTTVDINNHISTFSSGDDFKQSVRGSKFNGEPISNLNYESIEIASLLQLLADFSGKKLIHDGQARYGRAAISYTTPTPWDQILDELATKHRLYYKITDSHIRVGKK